MSGTRRRLQTQTRRLRGARVSYAVASVRSRTASTRARVDPRRADGLMVLAHGVVMDRDQVSAALAQAPPWQRFELTDERLVEMPGGAALVYRASAWRDGQQAPFVALMSSVYTQTPDGWRLALYQQTPAPGPT